MAHTTVSQKAKLVEGLQRVLHQLSKAAKLLPPDVVDAGPDVYQGMVLQ